MKCTGPGLPPPPDELLEVIFLRLFSSLYKELVKRLRILCIVSSTVAIWTDSNYIPWMVWATIS